MVQEEQVRNFMKTAYILVQLLEIGVKQTDTWHSWLTLSYLGFQKLSWPWEGGIKE